MKSVKYLLGHLRCACVCSVGFAQPTLPDSILRTLKPDHPRLLVRSYADFTDIRQRAGADEFVRLTLDQTLRRADSILNEPVVT